MKQYLIYVFGIVLFGLTSKQLCAQNNIEINHVELRETNSLNGLWNVRLAPFNGGGGAKMSVPISNGVEDPNFIDHLKVPGDWNTQEEKLYYFEGTIFYKLNFQQSKNEGKRYFIHFGAANYQADVYLNGKEIGSHIGGFTPFSFNITEALKNGMNTLVVRVENNRKKEAIPTIRFDWWNYGGLTRAVRLVEVSETFIQDYSIQLNPENAEEINGWVQLSGAHGGETVNLNIHELKLKKEFKVDTKGKVNFKLKSNKIAYWSPENPKQYTVEIKTEADRISEKVGFRTIRAVNGDILLNGKKLFIKGINLHEEAAMGGGRITTVEESRTLLNWAKELGCNLVRLAHYPHNQEMIAEAERLGLMVWAEVPVYWNIDFENEVSYTNAENMLTEMITRDKNRASVVLWSVANETRESDARQNYLLKLIKKVKSLDQTRLTTAAIEAYKVVDGVRVINDVIAADLDVIGINCYCGWYFDKPSDCPDMKWKVVFNKPVIFSEFGAGALQGHYGGKDEKWTENYQDEVFKYNIEMTKKQMPFLDGMTPWLLMDFRSPIRPNREIQNDYNRKGLISEQGIKKKAFYTLQEFYKTKK